MGEDLSLPFASRSERGRLELWLLVKTWLAIVAISREYSLFTRVVETV